MLPGKFPLLVIPGLELACEPPSLCIAQEKRERKKLHVLDKTRQCGFTGSCQLSLQQPSSCCIQCPSLGQTGNASLPALFSQAGYNRDPVPLLQQYKERAGCFCTLLPAHRRVCGMRASSSINHYSQLYSSPSPSKELTVENQGRNLKRSF